MIPKFVPDELTMSKEVAVIVKWNIEHGHYHRCKCGRLIAASVKACPICEPESNYQEFRKYVR
jgi:hypothetical protein